MQNRYVTVRSKSKDITPAAISTVYNKTLKSALEVFSDRPNDFFEELKVFSEGLYFFSVDLKSSSVEAISVVKGDRFIRAQLLGDTQSIFSGQS